MRTPKQPIYMKSTDAKIRNAAAYLILFNTWRQSNEPTDPLRFDPEPKKITEALELVTIYCLQKLNANRKVKL